MTKKKNHETSRLLPNYLVNYFRAIAVHETKLEEVFSREFNRLQLSFVLSLDPLLNNSLGIQDCVLTILLHLVCAMTLVTKIRTRIIH